jgi:L-ascorbate metabolism protein UlaG (beta-lactamase superfamily)
MTPPPSDHFNGKRFFYPGAAWDPGFVSLLRWKLGGKAEPWPKPVPLAPQPPPPAPVDGGVVATWIGQSTFLLQTAHGNFLTDPVFSDRVGPAPWLGPRRWMPPGLALDALPRIDAVLLSHDHYDHCDLPSLRTLNRHYDVQVFAPLGHRPLLKSAGVLRVAELDWWQTHRFSQNTTVTLTPARHWCRRRPGETNRRLWGGFLLRVGDRKIFFAGDTGYDDRLFREIAARTGPPDLALLPIGAYEPRWFMSGAHLNPAEAVNVHRDLGARRSVAMHWGTFRLTDEAREAPPNALAAARAAAGMTEDEFVILAPGASLSL